MTKIDLNIVERGTKGTDWIAENGGLTPQHLDDVLEQKSDNSGALNSLPTPFARFFVAEEAFRRASEEVANPAKEAGGAYRQIVSDILDVYELLFYHTYHKNAWGNEKKVELREWDAASNLNLIKQKMPKLFNSLNEYYKTDINQTKLYFLVYTENGKDMLLACTSPLTGFVTPPDLDKVEVTVNGTKTKDFAGKQYKNMYIRRKSGGAYFCDIKMFDERDADFKNYMYSLFGQANVDAQFARIREYIRSFSNDQGIRNDYALDLVGVQTDQNDDLVVNGLKIMMSNEKDLNSLFTPTLIKVPYRISREKFVSIKYQNDSKDRDYDYLLPFKPEVLALFPDNNINADLHINRNSVTVYLHYQGKVYSKEYEDSPRNSTHGQIRDYKGNSIFFNLGIFPNILSPKEEENNYFKIMVIGADESPEISGFDVAKIKLQFFKNGVAIHESDPLSEDVRFGVKPAVVRSRLQNNNTEGGTEFYEVFKTDFDAIEVNIYGDKGLLLPIFDQSEDTGDAYTYAIDLGTSNTFISRNKDGDNIKPVMFSMERPMVNYMHEATKNEQQPLTVRIENSIFDTAKNRIKTEFIPPFLDGTTYKFPIRTVLCGQIRNVNSPKLFDNHNIAFFYEKIMQDEKQCIHTNLKWEDKEDLIRIFISELLLMIKTDVLQRNGKLNATKLVWFRPLSFMGNMRETYSSIWNSEAERILGINESMISCFTESEAPYYFFKKNDYIKDTEAVAVIDIGGGSTDFVYFRNNKPQMANSVHFGCDVLWENGFNEYEDATENGIYTRYKDSLRFQRDDLAEMNLGLKVNRAKTKDIISFWLNNADYCDIKRNLSRDFKPVFAYHLTSILFYMASMYKDLGLMAPRSIIFSGNGSKYIDNFISADKKIVKKIIDLVFSSVFEGEHNVNIELPKERKESTCYGGLYRDANAEDVPSRAYQGDVSRTLETVGDINKNFDALKNSLIGKYGEMNALYKKVLDMLKKERIIDDTRNTSTYVDAANKDMGTPLKTYYQSIREKYTDDVPMHDSVFFLPIIDRVFQLTKLNVK